MYFVWVYYYNNTRRFEVLFFFVQTDSPRLILFTVMTKTMLMGFRKKCKQSASRVQAVNDQI